MNLKVRMELWLLAIASLLLTAAKMYHAVPYSWPEVIGFISGAFSVYLTVHQNMWLWPVSLVNNLFFGLLFWQSRLYADMSLQAVYFVLALIGWYWWLHGGDQRSLLQVGRATGVQLAFTAGAVLAGTSVYTTILIQVNRAAPFWDAFTTCISLGAQYLLTRKWLQNWYWWIAADLVYIPLYISRGLHLTALLYVGFLLLCLQGLRAWRLEWQAQGKPAPGASA